MDSIHILPRSAQVRQTGGRDFADAVSQQQVVATYLSCYDQFMRNGHLKNAKGFLERGLKEFQAARTAQDALGIRQAAEKGWGAAREATRGLLMKKEIKPARGTRRIEDQFVELEKRDKQIREKHLRGSFTIFLNDLHGECFGDGDIRLNKLDRAFRLLTQYIIEIERL